MDELSVFIKATVNISPADLDLVLSSFQDRVVEKGKLLVRKGQVVNHYFFISSGGLRIYLDKGDQQVTAWLAFENDFFTELNSVKFGVPTLFNIEAIEETTLLFIDKERMHTLYEQIPVWQQFGRKIWEEAFLKVVEAIIQYQTMSAEERYLNIMKRSNILQRVPLKQLASYLGITQTSLSRIRNNKR